MAAAAAEVTATFTREQVNQFLVISPELAKTLKSTLEKVKTERGSFVGSSATAIIELQSVDTLKKDCTELRKQLLNQTKAHLLNPTQSLLLFPRTNKLLLSVFKQLNCYQAYLNKLGATDEKEKLVLQKLKSMLQKVLLPRSALTLWIGEQILQEESALIKRGFVSVVDASIPLTDLFADGIVKTSLAAAIAVLRGYCDSSSFYKACRGRQKYAEDAVNLAKKLSGTDVTLIYAKKEISDVLETTDSTVVFKAALNQALNAVSASPSVER